MINFSSPALCAILNEIESSNNNHILDLGEMRPGTFNHFSSLSCKFHFENLREFLISQRKNTKNSFSNELDSYLTHHPTDTKFDVILLWDLINYLTIDEFVYIFDKLKPYCKENTLVHSITYMTKLIPKKPSRFQIAQNDSLDIELDKEFIKKENTITTVSMVKSLPGFMAETDLFNTNNLRIGLTENLLRYVPHLKNEQKNLTRKKYSFQNNNLKNEAIKKEQKSLKKHISPGLIYTLKTIHKRKDTKILNLGKDIQKNNHFFLKIINNIYSDSLLSTIEKNTDDEYFFNLKNNNLSYEEGMLFDAIFVWDLFNFSNKKSLEEVSHRLSKYCKAGTLIHVINYSGNQKPVAPQNFYLQPNGHIKFEPEKLSKDSSIQLNSTALSKTFKHCEIKKSFVLEKGMAKGFYEYILEHKSPSQ